MRSIKYFLSLAALLIIFVVGTSILVNQYKVFRRAYRELGENISHSSIACEVIFEEE